MAFEAGLLRSDSFTVEPDGFRVSLGLPWMRSLPFSSVDGIRVSVNGAAACPAAAVRIGGEDVRLEELAAWWDRFWFLQDRVSVAVHRTPAPGVGESLDVTVEMDLRIPYILTGPGRPLVLTQLLSRRLLAGAAGTRSVPREVA